MAGAGVVGLFDSVAVVAHAFDDAGVAAVAVLVEVSVVGDVGADGGDEVVAVVRGKMPSGLGPDGAGYARCGGI
ncbi:hypothetical protein GCM10022251_82790 [Phytohabitans flavus]|uniref:Uncharacterized protein n=1 Tax=Phytohabitans flavus TaxID=1076124 RepID=A0A6F8Y7J0_9ACTN|nr:hypothetical protein Pflav_006620 [Phytohabitans flavus]BCB75422.1 hypothetical protein Pflav_018320 [Phytohabitans flavus]BCB78668.1 hypothetical protein Pflav_050780 [Phytohabitans flavus]BCB79850.1 hypothetical protein Pflav_062600 [Phytohabitans flavus]BCB82082.1 hypothetical protein Pflav_084920 [Phytohabitans flavus]